ncbi:hypothetical protein [Streptomyces sp. VB1]|uniref:hypothetical protein n=1 Tax=Streptomyces sp. VB1 TaxID=2986803 RepID=UPI0022421436|nr:hypothetical protein [Streptomyces sp. VB1]UZI26688.1 hypothetical protein OH133_00365 [Streptomyces sp. VB1]
MPRTPDERHSHDGDQDRGDQPGGQGTSSGDVRQNKSEAVADAETTATIKLPPIAQPIAP